MSLAFAFIRVHSRFPTWARSGISGIRLQRVMPAGILLIVALVAQACADEIGQDFRGSPYNPSLFRPTGPNASGSITSDSQGLRITLTEEHGMRPAVGLALRSGLKGDFEITMEFELLQVAEPVGGNGAGVSIYVTMVSYTKEAATIWRAVRKGGDQIFSSHRATTPDGGKRVHQGGQALKTQGTSGKLRLTRTGDMLSYRIAEGSSDAFQEIFETEIGFEDIDMVRFAADNGGSPTLVDVRIKEVKVVTEEAGAPERLPPRPSRWPLWAGLGVSLLAAGGGYWYWSRR
ncbi:MAG: DUF1583 domain-containing protein [Planctomycetia bacterium]|nr:DUF1583 domain-containing protein [Planctomycetia bacterium]